MGCTYLLHSDAHVFITDRDLRVHYMYIVYTCVYKTIMYVHINV